MKIRSIKPEFFSDRKMAALSPHARLLYMALWCIADDEGRGRFLPKQIEGEAFPHEDVDVRGLLKELDHADRIRTYEADGEWYFHIPAFGKHQHPNRLVESKFPAPPMLEQCVDTADAVLEQCVDTADAPPVVVEVEVEGVVEGGNADAATAASKPPRERKRRTPPPERFEVTPALREWATAHGVTAVDLDAETERFLDHHRAKGSLMLQWPAAWRNWMGRAQEYASERKGNGRAPATWTDHHGNEVLQ